MNIIVNYPKTEQGMKELEKRAALAHSMITKNYIKNLSCPVEQKVQLINALVG